MIWLVRRRTLGGHGPPRRWTRRDRRGASRGRRRPGPADRTREGRLGRRRARHRGRRPGRPGRPRGPRPPGPPPARPPRDPGPGRLDQPGRAQPRLSAAHRAARGRLRGRDLLRAALHRAKAHGRRPRMRRHGMPARGGGAGVRRPGTALGPAGLPLEGATRPGCAAPASASASGRPPPCTHRRRPPIRVATGPVDAAGILRGLEDPASADRSGRAGNEARVPTPNASPRCAGSSRRPAIPASGCWPASGASTRRASTRTARPAATSALQAHRDGRRDAVIRRSPRRGWWAAAGRRSRPGASGRPWRGAAGGPKYVVCNADESEPGTFKDRADPRGGSVRARRGDDDRGLRGRRRARLPVHARRVPARRGAACANAIAQARDGRAPGRPTSRAAAGRSTSSCGAGPAPTSWARRRRCSSRSRAGGGSRATSRRSRWRRGCSASRPPSTTSRRWSTCRGSSSTARRRTPPSATRRSSGSQAVLPLGPRRAAGRVRGGVRGDAARAHRRSPAASRGARPQGRAAGRRGRGRSSGPRRAGHAAHLRGHARGRRDAGLRASSWCSTRPRTCRTPAADRRVLPRRVVRPVRPVPRGDRPPGGAAGEAHRRAPARDSSTAELALFADLAQAMRDASICGLGQTADAPSATGCAPRSRRHRPRHRGPARRRRVTGVDPGIFIEPRRDRRTCRTPPPAPDVAAVEMTIDGAPVTVPAGSTILEAARSLGIDTPTLCYVETLTPVDVCRVCVVEHRGLARARPRLPAAGEPGMEVQTDSERVRHSRRLVLELLGSSVDLSLAGPVRARRDLRGYARAVRRGRVPVRAAARRQRPQASATPRGRPPPRARRDRGDRRPAGQGGQRPLRPRLRPLHPLLQVRRGVRRGRPEHVRDRGRRARLRRPHLHGVRHAARPSPRACTAATASASARPAP